jgi:hypothetical protein
VRTAPPLLSRWQALQQPPASYQTSSGTRRLLLLLLCRFPDLTCLLHQAAASSGIGGAQPEQVAQCALLSSAGL